MKSLLKKLLAKKPKQPNMSDTITITGTGAATSVDGSSWTYSSTGATMSTTTVPNGGYASYGTSGTTVSTVTLPNRVGGGGIGGAGQVFTTTGAGTGWTTTTPYITTSGNGSSLSVKGDADFEGDVKIKGHSIVKLLEKMEDRLAILMDPDPEKLKKFQALKKAYDNYKLMEKLCIEDKKEGE
jgi:hypothetical protein